MEERKNGVKGYRDCTIGVKIFFSFVASYVVGLELGGHGKRNWGFSSLLPIEQWCRGAAETLRTCLWWVNIEVSWLFGRT